MEIKNLEKESLALRDLENQFKVKVTCSEQLMRDIASTKDVSGNFKYKNRQIEDESKNLEEIDAQIH